MKKKKNFNTVHMILSTICFSRFENVQLTANNKDQLFNVLDSNI